MKRLKYLNRKDTLFDYCYLAVKDHFKSKDDLNLWYANLASDEKRNAFLKVAPYYLALVKSGDWHVDIPDSNPVISYFTNTYKYITIISLIESLTTAKHIDFYDYLIRRRTKTKFPINKDELKKNHRLYKEEFGAFRRCVGFFKLLPKKRQLELVAKLEAKSGVPSIENFVKYLYRLRSEFVHQAELIHEMSGSPTFSYDGKNIVVCYLSITDAMEFFEEGLLAWCQS